jgi:putative transposase
MVTAPEYRHVPTGTLAVLAQRLGKVWASPSTWYHLVQKFGWRRPRLRVHPAKPKVGPRTTRADEMWHIDTTVIRLLDGTRAYLHAVIDNFSRRILAWRVADVCAGKQRGRLLEASRGATPSETIPVVLADTGGRQTRNMTGGKRPGQRIQALQRFPPSTGTFSSGTQGSMQTPPNRAAQASVAPTAS